MKSYTALLKLYQDYTNDTTSANTTRGQAALNDSVRTIASMRSGNWPWLQETINIAVSTVPFYLPASVRKIINLYVTVGTQVYRPRLVNSSNQWNLLLSSNLGVANTPQFYYIQNNQILFLPALTPDIGSVITIRARKRAADIGNADYTNGAIQSIANGSKTVVGVGTSWTSSMTGRYIQIATTSGGDGLWYQIASVTSPTQLVLVDPYEGTSFSANTAAFISAITTTTGSIVPGTYYFVATAIDSNGVESLTSGEATLTFTGSNQSVLITISPYTGAVSYRVYQTSTSGNYINAPYVQSNSNSITINNVPTGYATPLSNNPGSYTIGEMSVIPEQYDTAPVYRAAALFWMTKDNNKSTQYWKLYDGGNEAGLTSNIGGLVGQMMDDTGESTEGSYISPNDAYFIDPNIPPRSPINPAGGWGT